MTDTEPRTEPHTEARTEARTEASKQTDERPPTFFQMLGSTLGAALGVQTSKTRERDFKRGKASHFIVLGIAFTVVFVLAVVLVVRTVLSAAT